ncbi:protein tyrosine phosphatase [Yersinia enterocolitica]|uniref:protein-tyrosine-phosphatase n=1 Tax=Yersinia enterocolitica TaxID=630 RepID=A0A0H5G0A0_YEREN|nr:protein-tyrosine phosphatase family protein [Yersinia enterocolitica]EKN3331078.1 protein tyrosine phosphatase [Yersinia enterocolitica]EKN3494269.1 protein tyrosine phosphatase [Yersinia enterocolitica]EKN3507751.1 protein tyrosine phosphatase [Yersinia enterocolitica]EKN3555162.1 protein tyrosine phosphatase [Yersinia enterocolitica]EKN3690300.1 protein tyrosine phosphatase [Yersinia enterocolitica]
MPKVRPVLTPLNLNPIKDNRPKTDTENLLESLEKHQQGLKWTNDSNENIAHEYQRYTGISTPKATAIIAPNNIALPANHIQLGTDKGVIRSQYPTQQSVAPFIEMLGEKRATVLVVIGENNIFSYNCGMKPYPPYFRTAENNASYAIDIRTETHPGAEGYTIKTPSQINNIAVPVIHITNWKDKTALPADEMMALAKRILELHNEKFNIYAAHEANRYPSKAVNAKCETLPVIHCSAGVGRTGQLIAAMELINSESLRSLESIIHTLREQGGPDMVQTEDQMKALIDLADKVRKQLLDKDEQR